MHPATLTNFNRSYRLGALSGGNSFDHLVGAGEQPLIERQSRSILIVTHAREIKPGINFLCSTKEELVEGHESTGTQWISDAAEGDFYEESLCAQNRHEVKTVWEYACPIGDKVILRERYVRVAASNHLGKIAMYNADATGKVRRLRGEQVVGCLLSHQIIDSCTVSGASFRFANSLRQRDPRPAARNTKDPTISRWLAFANKHREATIPKKEPRLRLDRAELPPLPQRFRPRHHDIGVEAGLAAYFKHEVAERD